MSGRRQRARRGMVKAAVAARGLADLGPRTAGAVVASTARTAACQLRDRRAEREAGRAVPRPPGPLAAVEPLDDGAGARLVFARAELEVRYLAADLVRLSWGPDDPPVPWALAGPTGLQPPSVELSGDPATGCSLRAPGGLRVDVAPDGTVRHRGPDGTLLRHELPPLRRGDRRTARLALRPGERLAGLGEHAGSADLTGGSGDPRGSGVVTHRLWNRDPGGSWAPGDDPLYCGIPVLLGLHGDGAVLAFYENPSDATVRVDPGWAELTFTGGMLRHYLAAGPLPVVLERYTALTGRHPLPPRWALGYHQSRWGYRTEEEVRAVADGFAADRLPLSGLHLDIDHLDRYRVFTVDRARFPDLPGLADRLAGRGTRLVAIVDPGVAADPGDDLYRQGLSGGHFVTRPDGSLAGGVVWPGRVAYPDFTAPGTRRWWGDQYRRLAEHGIAGAWHDMNEPTSLSLVGDRTLPPDARHDAEGRGADHRRCHNVYGLLMDRAGWEGLAALHPDRRPFVLSRSGWAGVQRWAWTWTGDAESTWEGLAQQVATVVGMGLSGVGFTGPDTGGFSGAPDPELYLRWLELSVLLPFFRTHSALSTPRREPWRFPEPYRAAIGRLVHLRYRLLPYLYTLAHEASRTGSPPVRPLCWDGGSAWAEDAFLLGDDLLVAPAVTAGLAGRSVPVPEGRWIRWRPVPAMATPGAAPRTAPDAEGAPAAAPAPETDGTVEGGRTVHLDTPLGQPAVLVRAGAILVLDDGPCGPELDPGHRPGLLAFHCFPDEAGTAAGRCYDDAGDGDGPWRVDRISLTPGAGGPRVEWRRDGGYPPPERVRVVRHPPDGGRSRSLVREAGPFSLLDLPLG